MTRTDVLRRNLAHLGIILCHLSFVSLVFMLSGVFGTLLSIVIMLLGVVAIIFSFGTIFVIIPNYWSKLTSVGEVSSKFINFFWDNAPAIGITVLVCCVLSIVLTAMDCKWGKAKGRLIASSILLVVIATFVVVLLAGIIGGASK